MQRGSITLGIQTFSHVRKENYYHVDKTQRVLDYPEMARACAHQSGTRRKRITIHSSRRGRKSDDYESASARE
jgi:hypothetical protein